MQEKGWFGFGKIYSESVQNPLIKIIIFVNGFFLNGDIYLTYNLDINISEKQNLMQDKIKEEITT